MFVRYRRPRGLVALARPIKACSAGELRGPERGIGGLFAGAEEENPIVCEKPVNAGQQRASRIHGEVEHDVAQEDDIELVG